MRISLTQVNLDEKKNAFSCFLSFIKSHDVPSYWVWSRPKEKDKGGSAVRVKCLSESFLFWLDSIRTLAARRESGEYVRFPAALLLSCSVIPLAVLPYAYLYYILTYSRNCRRINRRRESD